jgi:hypothetical protein
MTCKCKAASKPVISHSLPPGDITGDGSDSVGRCISGASRGGIHLVVGGGRWHRWLPLLWEWVLGTLVTYLIPAFFRPDCYGRGFAARPVLK